MTEKITVIDKDIRMAIFFMTNLSTVLLFMCAKVARKGREKKTFDLNYFNRKISLYEIVFEAVTD